MGHMSAIASNTLYRRKEAYTHKSTHRHRHREREAQAHIFMYPRVRVHTLMHSHLIPTIVIVIVAVVASCCHRCWVVGHRCENCVDVRAQTLHREQSFPSSVLRTFASTHTTNHFSTQQRQTIDARHNKSFRETVQTDNGSGLGDQFVQAERDTQASTATEPVQT